MANNRIAIRCVCGGYLIIAKRYLDGYYAEPENPADYCNRLDAFFDGHKHCIPKAKELPTANGLDDIDQDNFTLAYENPSFVGQDSIILPD